ncbi:unnamed protein product [Vitrella brassicaformis CCMP3155]|uniref:AP-3 complex subunit beta n=3 Tax=Vitrella brassicaformis TaxID=1169539 RepID=A0A0G4GV26_VITBC|nr:unnamed protein product [Vitrella brassicaformis CCMP3155]|eukprot:CEM34749.1 unnamed protein product [Vitrella brassicaformis CCMP3155]
MLPTSAAPYLEKASAGVRDIISMVSSSESQYFDEEKFSEGEVKRSLNELAVDKKLEAMKRVLAAHSIGRDVSRLFPDVVKNIFTPNLELKKLVYMYLVQHADGNRDLALLSINSFQKDLSDRNPVVRASALRAMASIRVLEIIQLVVLAVRKASTDNSPYVRKTAAHCITKVYAIDPDQFLPLREILLRLLSDIEVCVVGTAMVAFSEMCLISPPEPTEDATQANSESHEASQSPQTANLALLHCHYRRLCGCLLQMEPWAQAVTIDVLVRYCRTFFTDPREDQLRLKMLSECGPEGDARTASSTKLSVPPPSPDLKQFIATLTLLLKAQYVTVVVSAASALFYLAPLDEVRKMVRPLIRALKTAADDLTDPVLAVLKPLIEAIPHLFRPHIRDFFVLVSDSPRVKMMKLDILDTLCDVTNVQLVLRELQVYVLWPDNPAFMSAAMRSITSIALRVESVTDSCLRGLIRMLNSQNPALAAEAVVSVRTLLQQRTKTDTLAPIVNHLLRYLTALTSPTARASVVWIIGEYQGEIPYVAPDALRTLTQRFAQEPEEVKLQILSLGMKVWAFHCFNQQRPAPEAINGETSTDAPAPPSQTDASPKKGPRQFSPLPTPSDKVCPAHVSKAIFPRLTQLFDHLTNMALHDVSYDVRDMGRAYSLVVEEAKKILESGQIPPVDDTKRTWSSFCWWYLELCLSSAARKGEQVPAAADIEERLRRNPLFECSQQLQRQRERQNQQRKDSSGPRPRETRYHLPSLAHTLGELLPGTLPLPAFPADASPDSIRDAPPPPPPPATETRSIESRPAVPPPAASAPSSRVPKLETFEDLDAFYSDVPPKWETSAAGLTADADSLWGGRTQPTAGTAVSGEDDESDDDAQKPSMQTTSGSRNPSQAGTPFVAALNKDDSEEEQEIIDNWKHIGQS